MKIFSSPAFLATSAFFSWPDVMLSAAIFGQSWQKLIKKQKRNQLKITYLLPVLGSYARLHLLRDMYMNQMIEL